MLPPGLVRYRKIIVLGLHLGLIPLIYFAAFGLRFDFQVPPQQVVAFWATVGVVLAVRMATFGAFGLYRGWWRYAGVADLTALVKATGISTLGVLGVLFFMQSWSVPRSILLIDFGLTIVVFGGLRMGVRILREEPGLGLGGLGLGGWTMNGANGIHGKPGLRTLIIGSVETAEPLIRELRRSNGEARLRPVGILDEDPTHHRMQVHGVPVLGDMARLGACLENPNPNQKPQNVIITRPDLEREQMMQIVRQCAAAGVACKTIPAYGELLRGRSALSQLRDVQVEDLLGRACVELDPGRARKMLAGKDVLVTGAGGSIGSELVRQIAAAGPRRLILLDQAESPLYFIDLEVRQAWPDVEVTAIVADVTDRLRMADVFSAHRPHHVFHAAAYKHVPMMEINVAEAVRNNIFGTLCVAQAAVRCGAERFVLISTDKAVNPSSVMGATKRITERIVLGLPALRDSRTDFRAVRFGNVLGSEGSVIPLFKRQIARGGPITLTHPDVTRYFMTIPEAVQLVLTAASLPEARKRISMLDMGIPIRIAELAENLIGLSGLTPGVDVQIEYIGLRPGEKLHEELTNGHEAAIETSVKSIRIVQVQENGGHRLRSELDQLAASIRHGRDEEVLQIIGTLVPEMVAPLRDRIHSGTAFAMEV